MLHPMLIPTIVYVPTNSKNDFSEGLGTELNTSSVENETALYSPYNRIHDNTPEKPLPVINW